jgi:hypothetical protein
MWIRIHLYQHLKERIRKVAAFANSGGLIEWGRKRNTA